jgi:cystathionine gamma-synthase
VSGFETRAIHAGQPPDAATGAVVPPITLATTFAQRAVGEHAGYEYGRSGNPTRAALEACLASLEGARHGLAFASGLAASDALLRQLGPGDGIVLGNDAYGGTYRLIARVFGHAGHPSHAADLRDPARLAVDIAAVAEVAHARGARLVVDNTFATPYLQQPLSLGADAVVHSSTKYLGGHSDVVGGFVATDDDGLAEGLAFVQNAAGAVPSPFDCYLVLRGVKTLAVRMDRHCDNARAVIEAVNGHPAVATVLYPGLPDHPGHDVAKRQMRDFGGMLSLVLRGGEPAALALAGRTRLFTLAESLGAVESLIEHPARMTHASAADSPLAVDPGLVRLSVGLETAADGAGGPAPRAPRAEIPRRSTSRRASRRENHRDRPDRPL